MYGWPRRCSECGLGRPSKYTRVLIHQDTRVLIHEVSVLIHRGGGISRSRLLVGESRHLTRSAAGLARFPTPPPLLAVSAQLAAREMTKG